MKKKLLIAMIPVLGMGALVGSGFSAWVFNNQASQTFNFNGAVTVEPATGDLTLDYTQKDFSVKLDQGGKDNTNVTDGITVTGLDTVKFTLKTNDTTVIDGGSHKAQVQFTFGLADADTADDINPTNNVTNYLALTSDMTALNVSTYADLTTTGGTLNSNRNINYTYSAGTWTFTITMPSEDKILNYSNNYAPETSGKPQTYADWNAMNSALNDKDLKITLKVDAQVIEA